VASRPDNTTRGTRQTSTARGGQADMWHRDRQPGPVAHDRPAPTHARHAPYGLGLGWPQAVRTAKTGWRQPQRSAAQHL
jgi:hypothetical protein